MNTINIQKAVTLRNGKDQSVKKRHHWIFSGAIKQTQNNPTEGDLVWIIGNAGKRLGYGFYGEQSIAVRIISFDDHISPENKIKSVLYVAYKKRQKLGLIESDKTNAYRLFHSEGDELPGLSIDILNDIIVIQIHHSALFPYIELIKDFLIEKYPNSKTIAVKHGKSKQERDNIELLLGTETETKIKENNNLFYVNIITGQKTGFFIDQRNNRELLGSISKNKSVLNLFCFTGGFSIYAINHGASRVVSVDSSKLAIDGALRNLNDLNDKSKHEFHIKDCEDFLSENKELFDIVICDPPALVKAKKDFYSGLQLYTRLQKLALHSLKNNGTYLSFSCSQFVHESDLKKCIDAALSELDLTYSNKKILRQASCHTYNRCHPESLYLKGYMLECVYRK